MPDTPDKTAIVSSGPVTSTGPVKLDAPPAVAKEVKEIAKYLNERPRGTEFSAPTTTEEEGLVSYGQRTINLIWENTQMKLALSVIWASLLVSCVLAVFGKWLGTDDIQLAAVVFLFGVANLVTGFYFGRTNHQRQGGVGGGDKDVGR